MKKKDRAARTAFRRGLIASLLLLAAIAGMASVPIVRQDRALDRIDGLGGGYNSNHLWLISRMPWKWRAPLKEKAMPPLNRILGVGWARRLERVTLVMLRNTESGEEDLHNTRVTDQGLVACQIQNE